MNEAKNISISIRSNPKQVYAYAANPKNLPHWATGLADASLKKVNGVWVTNSPMGKIKIKFAPKNKFGVMDHDVTAGGKTFANPFRVLKNGDGSEVLFTLYRHRGMTAKDFAKDAATIRKDLRKLKQILERRRK